MTCVLGNFVMVEWWLLDEEGKELMKDLPYCCLFLSDIKMSIPISILEIGLDF